MKVTEQYSEGYMKVTVQYSYCVVLVLKISINLLAFYHQRRSLIGYATHYLFCNR